MSLLIDPNEIPEQTILSGNTDVDKFIIHIYHVQERIIYEMLGSDLYNLMLEGYNNDTLSGVYLTIYNEYVSKVLKFYTIADYVDVASFSLDNGGLFKYSVENKESATEREVQTIKQKYSSLAQMYIDRFELFMSENHVSEYANSTDKNQINIGIGWKL